MTPPRAYTRIDLIITLFIVTAFALMLYAMIVPHRVRPRQMANGPKIRGIHQALIIYAIGNNNYYPGLDNKGQPLTNHAFRIGPPQPATDDYDNPLHPAFRFRLMLEDKHFDGPYAISPSESKPPWTAGPLTTDNYSFALLNVPSTGARLAEWRQTNSEGAIAISDRAIRNPDGHILGLDPKWQVAFNDNHTEYLTTFYVDTTYAKTVHPKDNLFFAESNNDAAMTWGGLADYIEGD